MAKGKKQRKADDSEDDAAPSMIPSDQDSEDGTSKAAGKKGKKDRKKKKEAELEDAQKELEALANDDDLAANDEKPAKKDAKKKKAKGTEAADPSSKASQDSDEEVQVAKAPAKKAGFAALMMDDSEDDHAVDSDEAPVIIKAPEPEKKKKTKKAKAVEGDDMDEGFDADENTGTDKKDKKKKKKKAPAKAEADEDDDLEKALAELNIEAKADEDEAAKIAAQKKKEKKERKKQKQTEEPSQPTAVDAVTKNKEAPKEEEDESKDQDDKGKKGKKKKKAEEEEDKKKGKKGPGKGTLLAMQEALKKVQEEQEKARREEEERIRREEEAEQERLLKKQQEEEKKALKKQREKERKEQLRKEGKLLSAKEKAAKARAEQMLAAMRAQGLEVPDTGVKRGPRPGTRVRNKNQPQKSKSQTPDVDDGKENEEAKDEEANAEAEETVEAESQPAEAKEAEEEEEDVLDSWETHLEDAKKDEPKKEEAKKEEAQPKPSAKKEESDEEEDSNEDSDSDEESDSEDSDDDEESESDGEEDMNMAEKRREKAIQRIEKRKADNEANRSLDVLRAPVVVVMGHVDTGKTKILDKLRRTNVQDGEAGGITQQIGATNVPIDVIHEQCKMVNGYVKEETKLPGLLIIDTPGHESFSNLRDRGSSLCDIAILVVDIMHSLEPQTIESINLLKKKKVPFIIALNKIDRLYEWKQNRHKDVKDVIESQAHNTKMEFEKRSNEVVVAMAEQGLNCALFYNNPDPKTYISMVPTSAHSGDGMGNLMGLLVKLSQTMLAKRLSYTEELQATVLEVKAIPGLGTTIDIVLVNGRLREGQTIIVAGTEGPIVTQIKALLTPAKMQDLRVKNSYIEHKEIKAAQGVKISAKELEKTVAGLNLLVAYHPDEVDLCKEEMEKRLQSALSSFKVKDRGVFVQASTLGSLEALLEFLRTSKIPYAGVKIGPVVKRDVMKASVMLEHEAKYTIILAFDVKIERDAQEMADSLGVKIFQADIIYHLFDRFTAYQDELRRKKREEFKNVAVFPCKIKVLPNFVFNSRDPIVCGVVVEAGVVRQGTPMCVPSKSFLDIGIVTSIQVNHKEVETARKGDEVCVKIDPIPGESPKMFGRHFDETDFLVSKISRASIDACKDYFRDDLQKSDWQLMVELKKVFEIL